MGHVGMTAVLPGAAQRCCDLSGEFEGEEELDGLSDESDSSDLSDPSDLCALPGYALLKSSVIGNSAMPSIFFGFIGPGVWP